MATALIPMLHLCPIASTRADAVSMPVRVCIGSVVSPMAFGSLGEVVDEADATSRIEDRPVHSDCLLLGKDIDASHILRRGHRAAV